MYAAFQHRSSERVRRPLITAATLVLVIGVQTTACHAQSAQPPLPSLNECIRQIERWRKSWETIEIHGLTWNSGDLAVTHDDLDASHPDFVRNNAMRFEFTWSSSGNWRWDTWTRREGRDLVNYSFVASQQRSDRNWSFGELEGLWLSPTGQWIDEVLSEDGWQVTALEDIEDLHCVRLDRIHPQRVESVWLARDFDFVPVHRDTRVPAWGQQALQNLELLPAGVRFGEEGESGEQSDGLWYWHATEVGRLNGITIPLRGYCQTAHRTDWQISAITPNRKFQADHFLTRRERLDATTPPPAPVEEASTLPNDLLATGIALVIGGTWLIDKRRRQFVVAVDGSAPVT